jgi:hypothetical protein
MELYTHSRARQKLARILGESKNEEVIIIREGLEDY